MPGLYSVAYEGGGQVPDALCGAYTSHRVAEAAIEAYKNK